MLLIGFKGFINMMVVLRERSRVSIHIFGLFIERFDMNEYYKQPSGGLYLVDYLHLPEDIWHNANIYLKIKYHDEYYYTKRNILFQVL